MKRITAKMLKDKGACASQLRLFKRVFPRGAPVSATSVRTANRAGLAVRFIECLIPIQELAAYYDAIAPALAAALSAIEKGD